MTRGLFGILFALLLSPAAMAGKHIISGTILDRNGEPVDRVTISLMPGNVQLVTDREGHFHIDYLRDDQGERIRLAKRTDYQLEIFKPGYHSQTYNFYYNKGLQELDRFTVIEDTIQVQDHGENLDPTLHAQPTNTSGATYEGQ